MARTCFLEHRSLLAAPVGGIGAAVGKGTARLGIDGAGHVAAKAPAPFLALPLSGSGIGIGGQKRLTIGMLRVWS